MAKTVAFGSKPRREKEAEAFVSGGRPAVAEKGKLKRLTIDLSPELHARIKVECAKSGRTMAAEIRAILEQRFS